MPRETSVSESEVHMSRTMKPADRARTLRSSVEQIWLAGLGAYALTEEQGSRFFKSLVTKGEKFEKARRTQLTKAVKRVREVPADAYEMVEKNLDTGMTTVLSRFGVPTKKEINLLARRVETLADRMEAKPARRPAARKPAPKPARARRVKVTTAAETATE